MVLFGRERRASQHAFHNLTQSEMSSIPPPSNPPPNPEKKPEVSNSSVPPSQDASAMDTTSDPPVQETWADIPEDIMALSTDEILTRIRLIDNDIKVRDDPTVPGTGP